MTKNRVDCVILNYNDFKTTIQLIKKISVYNVFSKIIVVDNNSSNNSFEKLLEFQSERVNIIKTDKNGGYGYGNNYGVKFCNEKFKSDYILIANPDVNFTEELVLKLLDNLVNNDAAVISAKRITKNGEIQYPNYWKVPSSFEYLSISFLTLSKFIGKKYKKESTEYLQEVECVAGSLLMVDVIKFLDVGGYDENMFLYGEETLLGYKMSINHYKTLILDEYYTHYHSQTISQFMKLKVIQRQIVESRKYIILEYFLRNRFIKVLYRILFFLVYIENTIILSLLKFKKMK